MKDYLSTENARNKKYNKLFTCMLKRAMLKKTGECEVLIGHHLTFKLGGNDDPNEVPSADCLMFDHDIMGAIFGNMAMNVMIKLVKLPVGERDVALKEMYDNWVGLHNTVNGEQLEDTEVEMAEFQAKVGYGKYDD